MNKKDIEIISQKTFPDSFHALQIREHWSQNEAFRSLAVPIGFGEHGECVELNIHETAHGPHGLISGAVGSGTSEFIQSYILSLAVHFHPQEVGILLIDDKDSKIAHLFEKLPHLLGTITNLDEELIHFFASIKGELIRRQRILREYNRNHINDYIKLLKQGKAKEPLPYLVLICDEFVDFKVKFPEYFKMLLEITRVGKCLGIHLILATQNAADVVDEQIRSICKFRICFKVKQESDSYHILKTPDAAYLADAGQAYLQVGNNEIYERFQSVQNGNPSLEKIRENPYEWIGERQFESVMRHIIEAYSKEKGIEVRKTWLPPLPPMIVAPYFENIMNNNNREVLDTTLGIGIVDEPEEQTQQEYKLDFAKKGHILYIASEGYGKSTFLGNIIIGLAVKNLVKNLKIFIIDMGNGALIPYKKLAHVADYFSFRDTERIGILKKTIMDMIEERKKIIDKKRAKNFSFYNQTQKDKLSAIIIVIDNYERLRDLGEGITELLKTVASEGVDLGIYLAVALAQMDAMKLSIMANFGQKIVGFHKEKTEIDFLAERDQISLPENKKGRALIELNGIRQMQFYTPVPCADDSIDKDQLENLVDQINLVCKKDNFIFKEN